MVKKILIYNSGGGLGDAIQLFSLILSLQQHFKSADLYYQDSLGANYFSGKLKEYNIKIKNLGINLEHFGFRWWHLFKAKSEFFKLGVDKFDLIIDIQSKIRNTLILKRIPTNNFYSSTYSYFFCTTKKKYIHNSNVNQKTLSNIEKFFETDIKKINYDLKILDNTLIDEAKKLLPNNNYIGFSLTHANEKRIKHWPLNKFIDLASIIETKNKIPVFFVEKTNQKIISEIKSKVPKALFPEHNSSLASPALVTALSSRLEMAISIDNGIMHMMSLADVPMIVLFGPTKPEKFAPDREKIIILDSKKMYKTNDISKIQVDDLLKYIN